MRGPRARVLASQALDARVAVIHRESRRSNGRPRIVEQLRQQGDCVSAERVRQSLRRQGLRPVYRRAYVVTTDSAHHLPVAPILLDRRFDGWQPDQALAYMPSEVVTCVYQAVTASLGSESMTRFISDRGSIAAPPIGAEFDGFIQTEIIEWVKQYRDLVPRLNDLLGQTTNPERIEKAACCVWI